MVDTRALEILFDTYWSSAGWKEKPKTPKKDFAYAVAARVMFPPVRRNHDELIDWLLQIRDRVEPTAVADAFLASLSTRRLDLRSAVGSFAIARHMPRHGFTASAVFTHDTCAVCEGSRNSSAPHDLNVLNFERFKWGGVRHLYTEYMTFDLERFLDTEPITSGDADVKILHDILTTAGSLPPQAKLGDLEKALAKLVKSNKEERRVLIQILGFCGILQPKGRPGFFNEFVPFEERQEPPWRQNDWPYPVSWWRGSDGVRREAVQFWFPQLPW